MNRRYVPSRTLLLHAAVVLLAAGAATSFSTTPVRLAPPAATAQDIQLQGPVTFRLGMRSGHELVAGSRWRPMGALAQGTVYRPLNQVFTLEGRRVDEAWPVIRNASLQGFFLPGEARFSPIRPVTLALRRQAGGDTEVAMLAR